MEPPARAALETGRPWPKLWSDNSHRIHPNWRGHTKLKIRFVFFFLFAPTRISHFPVREVGRTSETPKLDGQMDLRSYRYRRSGMSHSIRRYGWFSTWQLGSEDYIKVNAKTPRRLRSVECQKATVNVRLRSLTWLSSSIIFSLSAKSTFPKSRLFG